MNSKIRRGARICLAIPVYNSQDQLGLLIDQAREQTRTFDDIIVYSDASTDDSVGVAKKKGVKVIEGSVNYGSGYARNMILNATDCDYIHFHDADDPFLCDVFLEELAPHLQKDRVVFCGWIMRFLDGEEKKFQSIYASVKSWRSFLVHSHIHLNAMIFPVARLRELGGFDAGMRQQQDLLLNARTAADGLRFYFVDELLALHVKRASSTLGTSSKSDTLRWSRLLYLKMLGEEKIPRMEVEKRANWTLRELFQHGEKLDFSLSCEDFKIHKLAFLSRGRISMLVRRIFGIRAAVYFECWYAKLKN
jgi:glycosyltransferase involved in cell wall biosynthesis